MKKLTRTIAFIAATAALATGAYTLGHREGVRHAIEDSEVWLPEGYTTEEVSSWLEVETCKDEIWLDELEYPVEIHLDGEVYTHTASLE